MSVWFRGITTVWQHWIKAKVKVTLWKTQLKIGIKREERWKFLLKTTDENLFKWRGTVKADAPKGKNEE